MTNETLLLFPNVHTVMKADRLCSGQGIATKAVPVPEHISSECGMCLLINTLDLVACKTVLEQYKISFSIEDNRIVKPKPG